MLVGIEVILTGAAIIDARNCEDIIIEPFVRNHINPNSYNYRISEELYQVQVDSVGNRELTRIESWSDGYILRPHCYYLGSTFEIIGSSQYVVTLLGRSSIGRLGLFVNITADLGHSGACSRWTLELHVVQPLRIYPRMVIGQVAFWTQQERGNPYSGRYQSDLKPAASRDRSLTLSTYEDADDNN